MYIGLCLGVAAVTDCEVTLQGLFLDSIERSELSVTVGGEPCTERQAAEDDMNTVRLLVFISIVHHATVSSVEPSTALSPPVCVLSSRPASRREHRGPSCGKGVDYMS